MVSRVHAPHEPAEQPASRQVAGPVLSRTPSPTVAPAFGRALPPADRATPEHLLGLQRQAGNHAVAGLMGTMVVQRHPEPTGNEEVGEPDPGAGGETPVEAPAPDSAEGTSSTSPAAGTGTTGTGTTGTGTGTTGTGGAPTGAARRTAIENALDASDTGRWARGVIRRWEVPVDYEYAGTGSFHQGGRIYINRNLSVGGATLVLMHEAQHADTFKSGNQVSATSVTREEYIRVRIADEAEAVVRQIEGMAVTRSLGLDTSDSGVPDNLKQRYLTAFYRKRDELRAADPTMSTAAINATCRTDTRDHEVTNWFHDGTFVTSTDNNSYAVYYGLQWDAAHATPAGT